MRLGTKRKTFSSILILAPSQTGYMVTHVVVLYEKRWVSIVPSYSLGTHARSTALPKSALIPYLAYLVINLQRAK